VSALIKTPGLSSIGYLLGIVIFSTYTIARTENRSRALDLEIVLMYSIGITGFSQISNFVMHAFFGEMVARSIGWPAGNLFQLEVAGANLAIGLIGFLGFWRMDFWLPYLIAKTVFGWTAGVAHIVDLVGRGNAAVGNAGPILYLDFLIPLALIGLYIAYRRSAQDTPSVVRIRPLSARRTRS
jgi:hypothetical protein